MTIDCNKAQKNGNLCLGYSGYTDEPCEICKNCIKCESGSYQLGETEKDDQLEQAKEIIKHLLWDLRNPGVNRAKHIEKAEHFLGRDKISKEAEDFLKEDACQI